MVHVYFANGVEYAADETSLISSEVEYMGLRGYHDASIIPSVRASIFVS